LVGAATILSSSSSFILTRGEWTPFQTHCYSDNLVTKEIKPGTSGSVARNFDHKATEAVFCLMQAVGMYFNTKLQKLSS
jgi:hypothetical protein